MPRPPLQNCPAWARNAGLWAKAVRLSWRQLLRFDGAAPVVLLFADGGAGLLVGANPERNVVFLADPTRSGETPIAIDELRLHQVWSGEALLMRPERSQSAADASFSLAWLAPRPAGEGFAPRYRACLPDAERSHHLPPVGGHVGRGQGADLPKLFDAHPARRDARHRGRVRGLPRVRPPTDCARCSRGID